MAKFNNQSLAEEVFNQDILKQTFGSKDTDFALFDYRINKGTAWTKELKEDLNLLLKKYIAKKEELKQ